MVLDASAAKALVDRARSDPAWFLREVLGVELWEKQREIVEAYRTRKLIAVKSGNAIGKSYLSAGLAIHHGVTHCPSYTITTGASWTGVEKVLWGTIHRLAQNSKYHLGGTMLNTEWRFGPQWGIFGVSTDRAENFAGFRTENGVFVVVDEASALSEELYEAIMGLCASEGSKILLIGNPLSASGPFYDAFQEGSKWATFTVSSYDTPNVREGRTVVPGLADAAWIEERKEEWGEFSPQFMARVKGQFPPVRKSDVLKVQNVRYVDRSAMPETRMTRGWDLASSEKERIKDDPDYTVGTLAGFHAETNTLCVYDVVRGQWEAPERNRRIVDTAKADGRGVEVRIEAVAGYKDAFTTVRDLLSGISIVRSETPARDKVVRASVLEPSFDAGRVLVAKASWNKSWASELAAFPGGEHDDQVDSLVVAATHQLTGRRKAKVST